MHVINMLFLHCHCPALIELYIFVLLQLDQSVNDAMAGHNTVAIVTVRDI